MSDEFLEKLTLYTMTLAVPAQRNAMDPQVKHGEELFRAMGCASCHMPTLQTKESRTFRNFPTRPFIPSPIYCCMTWVKAWPTTARTSKPPAANRTPPLWGLGLIPVVNKHDLLLHDGRARGPAEAILWHGG